MKKKKKIEKEEKTLFKKFIFIDLFYYTLSFFQGTKA